MKFAESGSCLKFNPLTSTRSGTRLDRDVVVDVDVAGAERKIKETVDSTNSTLFALKTFKMIQCLL